MAGTTPSNSSNKATQAQRQQAKANAQAARAAALVAHNKAQALAAQAQAQAQAPAAQAQVASTTPTANAAALPVGAAPVQAAPAKAKQARSYHGPVQAAQPMLAGPNPSNHRAGTQGATAWALYTPGITVGAFCAAVNALPKGNSPGCYNLPAMALVRWALAHGHCTLGPAPVQAAPVQAAPAAK